MYVPLTQNVDIQMTYDEGVQAILESLAPLGSEYQSILEKDLKAKDGLISMKMKISVPELIPGAVMIATPTC